MLYETLKEIAKIDQKVESLKEELAPLKKELAQRESIIADVRAERRKLTSSLSALAPYKVGDKVTVHKCYLEGRAIEQNWQPREGIISKIIVHLIRKGNIEFEYKINRVKNDGTMSNQAVRYKSDTYRESDFSKID